MTLRDDVAKLLTIHGMPVLPVDQEEAVLDLVEAAGLAFLALPAGEVRDCADKATFRIQKLARSHGSSD